MRSRKITSSLLLVLTAFIWGSAFVAQSKGADLVDTFTFNAVRFFIGGLVLIPVIFLMKALNRKEAGDVTENPPASGVSKGTVWIGGILCGIALGIAANLQQFGIAYTTTGKAGFLTACYIVLVPIFGLFLKKKTGPFIWIGVLLAMVGFVFLCFIGKSSESLNGVPGITLGAVSISIGDLAIFACSIVFAVQILLIDHFSPLVNGVMMSSIQFFTVSAISAIGMLIFEKPDIHNILGAAVPILYTGVLSSGVAYTLQILCQKNLNPTVASLIMSLESSFSLICGWIILGERMSVYEMIGCGLIFVAIILAQLPQRR